MQRKEPKLSGAEASTEVPMMHLGMLHSVAEGSQSTRPHKGPDVSPTEMTSARGAKAQRTPRNLPRNNFITPSSDPMLVHPHHRAHRVLLVVSSPRHRSACDTIVQATSSGMPLHVGPLVQDGDQG